MFLTSSGIADRLTAEITYRPRARAYAPILSSPFPFSSTIKAAPEEWLEIASQILPYPSQTHVEAIECLVGHFPPFDSSPSHLLKVDLQSLSSCSFRPSESTPSPITSPFTSNSKPESLPFAHSYTLPHHLPHSSVEPKPHHHRPKRPQFACTSQGKSRSTSSEGIISRRASSSVKRACDLYLLTPTWLCKRTTDLQVWILRVRSGVLRMIPSGVFTPGSYLSRYANTSTWS